MVADTPAVVSPLSGEAGDYTPAFYWSLFMYLIKNVINRFFKEKITQLSGHLAYTTLLTIAPILIIIISIATSNSFFLSSLESLKPVIAKNFLPGVLNEQVTAYLIQFSSSASEFTIPGLIIILITGILMCNEIEEAFLHIWNTHARPLWQRALTYTILIVLGPVILGAAIMFSLYVLSLSLGLIGHYYMLEMIFNYGLLKGTMLIMFFFLYRFLPNAIISNKLALYVAAGVTASFVLIQYLFQLYLS